jgi:hypothetical protein
MTNDFLSSVPEFFYDLLGLFLPGIVTIELALVSPLFSQSELAQRLNGLQTFERILFILTCGYIVGQLLAGVSDLLVRKPVWLLFGEPAEALLGKRNALLNSRPRAFEESFLKTLESELEAISPGSLASHQRHSLLDICEQYIRQKDQVLGMLCQKRHAVLVMCRNMTLATFLMLPLYWSFGNLARFLIVLCGVFLFVRWNYLRTRRAELLYRTFHLTFSGENSKSATAPVA